MPRKLRWPSHEAWSWNPGAAARWGVPRDRRGFMQEGRRAGKARCPARPLQHKAELGLWGRSGRRHEEPARGLRPVPESRGRHSPHTSGLMRLGLLRETTNPQKSNDSSRHSGASGSSICDPEDS